jgi:16S rRNA C967 or C1407 C5-methylase (RsmB/RsmF family)
MKKKPDAKQILDMCAAPGSKTTQLAQLYPNATVYALDANEARLKTVNYNVERYKLNNVLTIKKEAEYASDLGLSFDAILLDAPCSGNYCVEENFFEKRNLHDITTKSLTQKKLFKAAYKILKKEGVLVYSTCSLEPEEDEAVVSWALEQFEDIELLEANIPIATNAATSFSGASYGEEVSKAKKFWPHITNTEGFFVAIFQRKK